MTFDCAGQSIHYEASGSGSEALVFLHGWGTSSHIWEDADHYLKNKRLLKVDLPGMGASSYHKKSHAKYLTETAELILKLLDFLKVEKAAFIGNSIGGLLALQIGTAFAGTTHVVFDSTPLLGAKGISLKPRLFAMPLLIRAPMFLAIRSGKVVTKLLADTFENMSSLSRTSFQSMVNGFRKADHKALYASLKDSLNYRAIPQLRKCQVPFLYISGKNNRTLDTQLICDEIKAAGITMDSIQVDQARHYPQLEQAGAYYGAVGRFLNN